jgi:hypothetical protein
MDPYNWECPHCRHKVTITANRHSGARHDCPLAGAEGPQGLYSIFVTCPNPECEKKTIVATLYPIEERKVDGVRRWVTCGAPIQTWHLVPDSTARLWPDFVPQAIREDYKEACGIRDLSPKASATLSRRALQGILRDFFKAKSKSGRLIEEIKEVQSQMDKDLWEAIDGARSVGNIGAHMEKDIDLIIDVDPNEAQIMIELVETVIDETYMRREERRRRLAGMTALAAAKAAQKALPPLGPADPA